MNQKKNNLRLTGMPVIQGKSRPKTAATRITTNYTLNQTNENKGGPRKMPQIMRHPLQKQNTIK